MSTYDMVNNDNWPEIPFVLMETESAGKNGFCTLDGLQLRAHIRKQIGSSRRSDDMQHES